jgi:quinol monooxygenase YgiN
MAFVQIIDLKTTRLDEIQRLDKEWEAAAGSDNKARRYVLCRDRDNADRYINIVFFDSYEEAMQNSDHPTTQEFAAKLSALTDGEPSFRNLDVIEEVTY